MLRFSRPLALVAPIFLVIPARAEHDPSIGLGVGAEYGIVGLSAEYRLNVWRRWGLSGGFGGPVIPTVTLGFWTPGHDLRLAVQGHAGWQPWESNCGTDPSRYPQDCHVRLLGAGFALDHDPGAPKDIVFRYGLGLNGTSRGPVVDSK